MADWIHCNRCFTRFQRAIEFELAECGHIFCPNCTKKCKEEKTCIVCKAHTSKMMVLSKTMPEEIKVYFKDTPGIIAMSKQVCEFQMKNYHRLLEHLTNKCNHLRNEANKQFNVIVSLKKENSRLKDLLRKAVAPKGQYASSTPHVGSKGASTFMDMSMSSVGHHSSNSTSFNNNFAKGQMFPGYPQRVPNIDHSHQGMGSLVTPSSQYVPIHRVNPAMTNSTNSTQRSMQRLVIGSNRR